MEPFRKSRIFCMDICVLTAQVQNSGFWVENGASGLPMFLDSRIGHYTKLGCLYSCHLMLSVIVPLKFFCLNVCLYTVYLMPLEDKRGGY